MTRILTVGADVPRHLVLAAGATPVRIVDDGTAVDDADRRRARELLGAVDRAAVAVLARVLTEPDGDVASIVVSHDGEASLRIFYVLRMMQRAGRLLPPVRLLDLQRLPGDPVRTFNRRALRRLVDHFETACGVSVDEAALSGAARREKALGGYVEALRARRRLPVGSPHIPAEDVARLLSEARVVTPEAAGASIDAYLADGVGGRGRSRAPRVVLTGSAVADPGILRAIEEAGVAVVADDHHTGDDEWLGVAEAPSGTDRDPIDEVVDGLVDFFARRSAPASFGSIAARAGRIAGLAADVDAAAVLCIARAGDDAPRWDAHAQRRSVERDGREFIGPLPLDAMPDMSALSSWARTGPRSAA